MSPLDTREDKSLLSGVARGALIAVFAILGLVIVAAVVAPRFIGAVPLAVLTGSMEPALSPGDLIVAQKIDPSTVRAGDIVTYQPEPGDPALITHRVEEIAFGMNGVDHFITRGDANGVDDALVKPGQVMGKYIYHIPYLGHVTTAIPAAVKPFIIQIIGGLMLVCAALQLVNAARTKRRKVARTPSTWFQPQIGSADVTR